ncbi:MAG: rod shape-determining protein MreC [Parachlamydia sp.]|nr:MAG: rod shape-determining protein MreC [Parachlamydia sp.]
MSIPQQGAEKLRGTAASFLAPSWKNIAQSRIWLASLFSKDFFHKQAGQEFLTEQIQSLQLENQLLHLEINRLKLIEHHLGAKSTGVVPEHTSPDSIEFQGISAKVIFRSPSSWHNSLWLDVGEEKNKELGFAYVAKNSPVTLGTSVLGIIDYVGKKQSRVKLISDPGLSPAVRVHRGSCQKRFLLAHIEHMLDSLRTPLLKDPQLQAEFKSHLENFKEKVKQEDASHLVLAKGELKGCCRSSWRSQIPLLRGVGFNYDFADNEGPARDLRTGIPENLPLAQKASFVAPPLVKVGDLLVTTGMDGLFPEGLNVAKITYIHPLKEGDYYYELDALPTVENMDDLSIVFILPPLGYNQIDLPAPIGR